ncbi:MAG: hypothetical protein H0T73_21910 [Ardenticatenales bacterium]|nr:hypothetical protein [Ardenticatenales bacterium]
MRPLVYWARAEKVRVRPTHKNETRIEGTLMLPDGQQLPFDYHRQELTLVVGRPGERSHALEGEWQLDEFGVPTRREQGGTNGIQ